MELGCIMAAALPTVDSGLGGRSIMQPGRIWHQDVSLHLLWDSPGCDCAVQWHGGHHVLALGERPRCAVWPPLGQANAPVCSMLLMGCSRGLYDGYTCKGITC